MSEQKAFLEKVHIKKFLSLRNVTLPLKPQHYFTIKYTSIIRSAYYEKDIPYGTCKRL